MPDHNPVGIESMPHAELIVLAQKQAAEIDRLRINNNALRDLRDITIAGADRDASEASATIATLHARVRHLTQALAAAANALTSYN